MSDERPLPDSEFDLLDLLDRLETLLEDMDELGVGSRIEAEELMNRIHARLDAMDDDA
jgi:hypothetical protein